MIKKIRRKRGVIFLKQKKAVSLWLSWVLLVAFMVLLSTFVYNWIIGFAGDSGERLEKRYNEGSCASLAIDTTACQKAEDLNIIINNNGNLEIDKVIFRIYDLYGNVEIKKEDISIKAGEEKEIEVLKQGAVDFIESIPIIVIGDNEVVCVDKIQTNRNITVCN